MKNAVSVIIPTLLENVTVLQKLINILDRDEVVDEIIIINNALKKNLKLDGSKVKIHTPIKNLYVNASWNYGISISQNENFLIINDDILCVENFCSLVIDSGILEKEDTGLIGIDNSFIKNYERVNTTDIEQPESVESSDISFSLMSRYWMTGDWGSAILGKKINWYKIPDSLKIIFGDNYLLKKNIENNKKNYRIIGAKFNHIHSLSSSLPQFGPIVVQDVLNSNSYFPEQSHLTKIDKP